ncbi:MAG: hypothetical protein INQ03_04080 [Candidatus Heimdallarchaeota archaeon]|nr:hypothetical protein [Candidatus Heimdallarchaeota archaeon]
MSLYNKEDTSLALSENEKRVLHALVKWPELSDQAIHSRIKMKKSTFSSIKARLRERGFYKKYYIPNFPKIGFELFHVLFGNLNRFTTFEERMRVAGDIIKSFDEDFLVVSASNQAFNLSISKNYTEYSKNQERFFQVYSENKFLTKESMKTITFPFEISRVRSFMDFEALVAKVCSLNIEAEEEDLIIPTGDVKPFKLTRAEKKVLVGLIKYSEESDTLIAEKVGVSRNTVANAKRKFLKDRICFPRIVPDLEKLGLKLLVFTYRKFNPKSTMKERQEAIRLVKEKLSPHFYISMNLEGILISAHQSFEEYNKAHDEVMQFYLKHDYISEEPITLQFSLPHIETLKDYDFLNVVCKMLEFDPDEY